MSPQRIKI